MIGLKQFKKKEDTKNVTEEIGILERGLGLDLAQWKHKATLEELDAVKGGSLKLSAIIFEFEYLT